MTWDTNKQQSAHNQYTHMDIHHLAGNVFSKLNTHYQMERTQRLISALQSLISNITSNNKQLNWAVWPSVCHCHSKTFIVSILSDKWQRAGGAGVTTKLLPQEINSSTQPHDSVRPVICDKMWLNPTPHSPSFMSVNTAWMWGGSTCPPLCSCSSPSNISFLLECSRDFNPALYN